MEVLKRQRIDITANSFTHIIATFICKKISESIGTDLWLPSSHEYKTNFVLHTTLWS